MSLRLIAFIAAVFGFLYLISKQRRRHGMPPLPFVGHLFDALLDEKVNGAAATTSSSQKTIDEIPRLDALLKKDARKTSTMAKQLPNPPPPPAASTSSSTASTQSATFSERKSPAKEIVIVPAPIPLPDNNNNNNNKTRSTASDSDISKSSKDSVPPGDILTHPDKKIVFNAPFGDKHTYHIKITNGGGRRIAWVIKTTNNKRLGVDPPFGVLDPKESVLMAVSCDAFNYEKEDTTSDRIIIEWTNTPEGAAKKFVLKWFKRDVMVRRKNLPIEYNF